MKTAKKPQKPIEKAFLVDGRYLYEMVGEPKSELLSYVRYDKLSGEIELHDKAVVDEVVYIPPQNRLAFTGTILLPKYPREYGEVGELLQGVRDYVYKYLELPDNYLALVSYYVLLTWVFDGFEVIPYLRARGDYGTGKSRFLRVIGSVCYRPCFAGGSSTVSPIFRLIDMYGGLTLILDEADFRFSGPDVEIVKILNTGYMKDCPVLRTEGDRVRVPTSYNCYGPKIIATRKEFQDKALESRCLTNYMTQMTRGDIPLHLTKEFYRMASELRDQLLMFRLRHFGTYEIDDREKLSGVEPRINQVLLPLFALADSEEMKEELRSFARQHASSQAVSRGDTLEADVLEVMCKLAEGESYIPVKQISTEINKSRDKEQGEYLVSPSKVGRINRTSYGFKTRRASQGTEIIWDAEMARGLCVRFNLCDDLVNHVQDVHGSAMLENNNSDIETPEVSLFKEVLNDALGTQDALNLSERTLNKPNT